MFWTLGLNGLSHKGVLRKLASTLGVPLVCCAYWVNLPEVVKTSVHWAYMPSTPHVRMQSAQMGIWA